MLVLGGIISEREGSVLIPYVTFDPKSIEPGVPVPIDFQGYTGGAVLYTDNNLGGELIQAGFMTDGEILFDTFENSGGGTVKGMVDTSIYAWEAW